MSGANLLRFETRQVPVTHPVERTDRWLEFGVAAVSSDSYSFSVGYYKMTEPLRLCSRNIISWTARFSEKSYWT